MTRPTTPTIGRLRASISGASRALSLLMTYWDTSPIMTKEVRKITETMPIILQLYRLEKDLLFT
ncbi:MAG: hypothetical protein K6F58_03900 [Bacteroidales bacterium]|nr:hypothetical protein [Bacteroidales bacterium]